MLVTANKLQKVLHLMPKKKWNHQRNVWSAIGFSTHHLITIDCFRWCVTSRERWWCFCQLFSSCFYFKNWNNYFLLLFHKLEIGTRYTENYHRWSFVMQFWVVSPQNPIVMRVTWSSINKCIASKSDCTWTSNLIGWETMITVEKCKKHGNKIRVISDAEFVCCFGFAGCSGLLFFVVRNFHENKNAQLMCSLHDWCWFKHTKIVSKWKINLITAWTRNFISVDLNKFQVFPI